MSDPESPRPIRAMQSFGTPRPTSNPYIHMLDAALARTPGVEHIRFDRRRALLGRYDVLHFHWPETLFGGSTRTRALIRRLYAEALRLRLSKGRIAVVRTAHNVELPKDASHWERRYLEWIERRADHRIVLNPHTRTADDRFTLIPHGHYRDWFSSVPREAPLPGVIGFVGLVRRYKGVEDLIDAFSDVADDSLRLRIAGNPTSATIADEVRSRTASDPRVDLDLRYLSEEDFARAVMSCSGIVLPYRFMHNSGTALAALSLDRPVLVPRNDINEALAREVGEGWVVMYDGALTGDVLAAFARSAATPPGSPPDLSARTWERAGVGHREAFRAALESRRAGRR